MALDRAIAINNEGTLFLQLGRIEDAMRNFQKAAFAVKDAPDDVSFHAGSKPIEVPPTTPPCEELTDMRPPRDDVLFMYSRPLVYPVDTVVSNRNDVAMLKRTLSSYAIFNLALASHLHGVTTGKDTSLRRAWHLYHNLISAPPRIMSPQNNVMPYAMLQSLAFNNLAHIYNIWCKCEVSKHCMLECINSIDFLVSASEFLCEHEVQEIFLNAIIVKASCAAQAA